MTNDQMFHFDKTKKKTFKMKQKCSGIYKKLN